MSELSDDQVSWAELALHVLDKGLSIRPSTLGFLLKGQLLELLNKSGEKFLRKALATTGYGNAVSDPLVRDVMESLVYSLLNNSPRYALQTAKQYATAGGGGVREERPTPTFWWDFAGSGGGTQTRGWST